MLKKTSHLGASWCVIRDACLVIVCLAFAPAAAAASDDSTELLRNYLEGLAVQPQPDGALRSAAPDVVHAFYQARGFATAWDDARASALVALVSDAPSQGLDPDDYLVAELQTLQPLSALSGPARVAADVLLTEAFLRYAYHNRFGKVDPASLEPTWNYGRTVSPGGPYQALERILGAGDFAAQFAQEVGHGPVYQAMRALLARYRVIEQAGGWAEVSGTGALKPASTDARVPELRRRLAAEGFLTPTAASSQDTVFDAELEAGVRQFQSTHGLEPDGVLGKRTWEELNVGAAERVEQVRLNLERLRWVLVERTPRFIAVNIAGFRVYYVEDDAVQWSTRAVVGRPYRETPVFRADMKYLVINPDWTVPPTILRRDVLPALRRDAGYLASHQMDVIDGHGQKVDTSTIDWSQFSSKRFPYQVRQRPGPTNSLGRVKFMFPNSHFVYLHDTPARDLFQKQDRSFSSGCIRVENPLDLAEILLRSTQTWSRAALDDAVASGKTQTVFLTEPIPVMLLYLTAIAFEGGRDFSFYHDVYGRDAKLREALDQEFKYVPPQAAPVL